MENNEQNIPQGQGDCPDSTQDSSRAKVLKTAIFVIVVLAACALFAQSFLTGKSSCRILCGAKSVLTPCSSTTTNPEISACPLKQSTCAKDKTCAKKACCPLANQADKPDLSNPDATAPASCPKTSAEK